MKKIDFNNYKIISFDIFDTLIIRNVDKPSDIFDLVELKYNSMHSEKIDNFKKNRMNAERECRIENINGEIKYKEIYDKLKPIYGSRISEELSEIEIDVEFLICAPNCEIINIYKEAIKKCDVIITSDMYFDKEVISRLLRKNGYDDYKKLYLSSEINKTKAKGDIYTYIKKDFNVSPEKILHIGDNKISDETNAREEGLSTYLYKNRKLRHERYNNKVVNHMLNNYASSSDYFQNFGYSILGPMLYSFIKWLKSELTEAEIKKVYFFARDGYLMKMIFDIINTEHKIESFYFYTSRRALLVPSFYNCANLNELIDSIQIDKKYIKLKKRIGIEDIDVNKYEVEFNIKPDDEITRDILLNKSNLRDFLDTIFPIIKNNSINEYHNFLTYANKNKLDKDSAIVDIGWYGNMQNYLNKLLGYDVNGYYFGLIPNGTIQNSLKMKGYLFDKNHGHEIYEIEKTINPIVELLFTAPHGSVHKYEFGGNIKLYDNEYNKDSNYEKIKSLQDGAIEFVNNYIVLDDYFKFDNLTGFQNILRKFALNPLKQDVVNWGNFLFHDNGEKYIAKSESIYYYLLHPKKFIFDFKQAYWKIGFLKQNFSILIPLYKKIKIRKGD